MGKSIQFDYWCNSQDLNLPRVEEHRATYMHGFYVLHMQINKIIVFIPFDMGVQHGYLYESSHQVNCKKIYVGRTVHIIIC